MESGIPVARKQVSNSSQCKASWSKIRLLFLSRARKG
ncbi:conserved hypothetical protein, partial [Listeria ivanovii FSL F6-596]